MTETKVPIPAAFFHAILKVLSAHPDGIRRRDVHEPVADAMALGQASRAEKLPSGAHLRYQHRIGWGNNMLKVGGYVDSPSTGVWRLTPRGAALIKEYPIGFPDEVTRRIVRESREGLRPPGGADELPAEPDPGAVSQTPDERIDQALKEIESAVARDLLERIGQTPPAFFEEIVLVLLHSLGYGKSEDDLEVVGGVGDGGIDGVISLDKLGFEKIYVQAKRWLGSVGRPEIQAFYGALAGRRASKGVFITTGTFTREAREFADQIPEKIVLIDGRRLTGLMIEYGVLVSHYRLVKLPRVNTEAFDAD